MTETFTNQIIGFNYFLSFLCRNRNNIVNCHLEAFSILVI